MKEQSVTPLRCLIIDDESAAHKTIKFHIDKVPWLEFSQSCMNAVKALEIVSSDRFDLIFLDVDMPHISGIELLKVAGPLHASVVMTTAHSKYAIDGFDHDIIDFLLKPISFERFVKAANRARLARERKAAREASQDSSQDESEAGINPHYPFQMVSTENLDAVLPHPAHSPVFGDKILWIRVDKDVLPVEYQKLHMIRSCGNYVRIFAGGKTHMVRTTLTLMIRNLPGNFILTNRSYIVNSDLVKRFTGNEIFMNFEGYMAKISKDLRTEVFKKLNTRYG